MHSQCDNPFAGFGAHSTEDERQLLKDLSVGSQELRVSGAPDLYWSDSATSLLHHLVQLQAHGDVPVSCRALGELLINLFNDRLEALEALCMKARLGEGESSETLVGTKQYFVEFFQLENKVSLVVAVTALQRLKDLPSTDDESVEFLEVLGNRLLEPNRASGDEK